MLCNDWGTWTIRVPHHQTYCPVPGSGGPESLGGALAGLLLVGTQSKYPQLRNAVMWHMSMRSPMFCWYISIIPIICHTSIHTIVIPIKFLTAIQAGGPLGVRWV